MRTKNTIKNISSGILLQGLIVILGFVSRKIFIDVMGIELLGINGLLANVLSMLSLVELGIGSAIYYSLYKPLAEEDTDQVKAIMDLYSKMYKYIGVLVAVIGLILLPFLSFFMEEEVKVGMPYVRVIYLIFLTDSVISYFLAYRRNILSADQKNYVLNKYSAVFTVFTYVSQILIIYYTKNFILYLLVKLVLMVIQNIIIYQKTNKEYPYLKSKEKKVLNKDIKDELIKNIKALFLVNIAVYCVFSTDNLLISKFAGVIAVGIYSNYYLIINTINTLMSQVFQGIKSSFGNFLVEKSKEEAHKVFEVIYFLNFWIMTFCATSFIVLINPFISKIWLHDDSVLFPMIMVIVLVYNFYARGMTNAMEVVRNGAGMYSPYPFFKYWSIIEGIVNLIASVILGGVLNLGMIGVFIGTAISTCITVFVLPWNVYKYVFNMSSKVYYLKYALYNVLTVILCALTYFSANFIKIDNAYLQFIINALCCIIVPNVIILVLFLRTKEMGYLKEKFNIKEMIKQKRGAKNV